MDAIEKAIRSAFEKGDPSDRAFREKVYRSAFAALERSLQANPNMTPAIADRRRQTLSESISSIESEFLPAVPSVEPARDGAAPAAPSVEPAREPAAPRRDFGAEIDPPVYEGYDVPQRRGRSWAALLATALVLVLIGVAAWWMFAPGPDPALQFPRPALEDEDFEPEETAQPARPVLGADDLEDWIVIFEPSDPTTVSTPGDSQASVTEDEGEQFLRITSGASGAPVLFDVGQGVLEQVAGRRAVFNIVARAEEGQETQISVDCSLGELGDCGRKRYAVGITREDFLFEMTLPRVDPGAGGTIAINPDIGNTGRSVDIFSIRVSPAE